MWGGGRCSSVESGTYHLLLVSSLYLWVEFSGPQNAKSEPASGRGDRCESNWWLENAGDGSRIDFRHWGFVLYVRFVSSFGMVLCGARTASWGPGESVLSTKHAGRDILHSVLHRAWADSDLATHYYSRVKSSYGSRDVPG